MGVYLLVMAEIKITIDSKHIVIGNKYKQLNLLVLRAVATGLALTSKKNIKLANQDRKNNRSISFVGFV